MGGRSGSLALIGFVLLAGCTSPGSTLLDADGERLGPRPLVIALLDTGGNPYFDVFSTMGNELRLPVEATVVTLSNAGDIQSRIERDDPIWSQLEARRLYHFENTRMLGITFYENAPNGPILDYFQHGSGTSYLAARDAPGAIIVVVQVDATVCESLDGCITNPTIADGMEWIAEQPWIDVVSISIGRTGNAPAAFDTAAERYVEASERAHQNGKIIVNAAGNTIVPPITGQYQGPPWTILVGGVETSGRGDSVLASKTIDVVANMSDYAPIMNGEFHWRTGTSYATPIVAGTIAHGLQLIREADPTRVVTQRELRDALNASAVYFNATDWDPTPPGRDPSPVIDALRYATLPIVAQPQMGWGYVEHALAPEIARRVLEQDYSMSGKEQAEAFQPAWQQAREEFWARWR